MYQCWLPLVSKPPDVKALSFSASTHQLEGEEKKGGGEGEREREREGGGESLTD